MEKVGIGVLWLFWKVVACFMVVISSWVVVERMIECVGFMLGVRSVNSIRLFRGEHIGQRWFI